MQMVPVEARDNAKHLGLRRPEPEHRTANHASEEATASSGTSAQRQSAERRRHRVERYEQAVALDASGHTQRAISPPLESR